MILAITITSWRFYKDQYLIFDGPSDRVFHGNLSGMFRIVQEGSGTVTFRGEDLARFGGAELAVSGGTMVIDNAMRGGITVRGSGSCLIGTNGVPTSSLKVESGGTLGGFGVITKSPTMSAGSWLAPGSKTTVGTLSGSSAVTLVADSGLRIKVRDNEGDKFSSTTTITLPTAGKMLLDVVGVSKEDNVRLSKEYVILETTGTLNNFDPARWEISTSTPKLLDVSEASVKPGADGKSVVLTGVKSFDKALRLMVY